jgi:pimeloyl-ACP methyl ester carboxylesterase
MPRHDAVDPSPNNNDVPDVVLLPGFVGMNMDDAFGRRVWLSPLPIAAGDLAARFALDPSGTTDAIPGLGVHPNGPLGFIYGRAIRAWEEAGLVVHVFPLEFRTSVLETAAALRVFVDQITAARGPRRFVFVGHSMGAILAALYPYHDPDWEQRIAAAVFFGGTLAGTFEPVEGLTGTHWFLKVVGLGDPAREHAIQRAMSTWPGIFGMLPDPVTFPEAAGVYEAGSWSEDVRPSQARLDEIKYRLRPMVRDSPLRKVPTLQLMSIGCPTVDSIAWSGGHLRTGPMTAAGDGTVAARTAYLGVDEAFEVDFPHTFMPNDPKAIQAVIDVAGGSRPSLPLIDEARANARLPDGQSPPLTMARALFESLGARILTGHAGLDDLWWPLLR